jgi:alkylation response protein AidB-like acyl-CoA dehydrogenase
MDFDDSPEEAAFRAEAFAWLSAHAALRDPSAPVAPPTHLGREAEAAHVERCKAWQRTLFDGGWAGITWPKEFGGRGGTPIEALIFSQEQARFDVPGSIFVQGIGMAGPTIMAHGTDWQKERFLRPMLRGDEVWCQMFSEPGAGSDLASLATKALRDGDEYVVNGQKVWTSSAHVSDWGILLARTDPAAPKHKGITYFLVDMTTPGIDVRPLRQATGAAHFNEVFLTDVRIPATGVVGPENEGWRVTVTTLANERVVIGSTSGGSAPVRRLLELARRAGHSADPGVRQQLADAYTRAEIQKYLGWRVQTAVARGEQPGPESSVLKLALSVQIPRSADLAMSLLGAEGMALDYDDPEASYWQLQFVGQWASRLGGGTEQVQRNIIGERVLGLPREPA